MRKEKKIPVTTALAPNSSNFTPPGGCCQSQIKSIAANGDTLTVTIMDFDSDNDIFMRTRVSTFELQDKQGVIIVTITSTANLDAADNFTTAHLSLLKQFNQTEKVSFKRVKTGENGECQLIDITNENEQENAKIRCIALEKERLEETPGAYAIHIRAVADARQRKLSKKACGERVNEMTQKKIDELAEMIEGKKGGSSQAGSSRSMFPKKKSGAEQGSHHEQPSSDRSKKR